MNMKEEYVPDFWGDCKIISQLELKIVADILSKNIFGGIPFIYGEHSIWEEVPSMYIDSNIFGLLVIIGGYGGSQGYDINVQIYGNFNRYLFSNRIKTSRFKLDMYLYYLLKEGLKDYPEMEAIEPKKNDEF